MMTEFIAKLLAKISVNNNVKCESNTWEDWVDGGGSSRPSLPRPTPPTPVESDSFYIQVIISVSMTCLGHLD